MKSARIVFVAVVFFLPSCGKKKEILTNSTVTGFDGSVLYSEEYIDNDSAFESTINQKTNVLVKMRKAANDTLLRNGTYAEFEYYPSGKLMSLRHLDNNLTVDLNAWYEDGKLRVKEELLPDSTYRHREYYENGNPEKEMLTDKDGKGSSTFWFMNGQLRNTGPICDFNPCGVWKGYDSLGNPNGEELVGMPKTDSTK